MESKHKCRSLVLASLGSAILLSFPFRAGAEPSLEASKAQSGIRFAELGGSGFRTQDSAVAAQTGGKRSAVGPVIAAPGRASKASEVPPPKTASNRGGAPAEGKAWLGFPMMLYGLGMAAAATGVGAFGVAAVSAGVALWGLFLSMPPRAKKT